MRRRKTLLLAVCTLGALTVALSAALAGALPLTGGPLCVLGCSARPAPRSTPAPIVPGGRPAPAPRGSRGDRRCHPPRWARLRPPRPEGTPLAGIHAGLRFFRGRALCRAALRARHAGARLIRENVSWSEIEPRPGRYRWARTDEWIGVAARYGLTVLPLLSDVPPWVARNPTTIPARPNAFAGFTARVVARYGPDGTFWRRHPSLASSAPDWFELWNEPFLPISSGGHPDAARYARLVRATVPRARRANPAARFLIAGETTYGAPRGAPRNWTEGLYRQNPGFGAYFDGVAVHPYSGALPPNDFSRRVGEDNQTRRLERVRQSLIAHGDGDKPLWITEIGWSTCGRRDPCVGVAQQARYLRTLFQLVRQRWPYIPTVVVYALNDYTPAPEEGLKEGSYGLLRADARPKPSYRVFQDVSAGR